MKTYKIKIDDCIHPNAAERADDTRVLDLESDELTDSDIEEEVSQEEASLAPMESREKKTPAPLTKEERRIYEQPGFRQLVKKAKCASVIQTKDDAETVNEAYDELRECVSDTDIDMAEFKWLVTAASVMPKRSSKTLWTMRVWAMLDAGMRSANGDKKLIRALEENSEDNLAYAIAQDTYAAIARRHPFGTERRSLVKQHDSKSKAAKAPDAASSAADMCPVLRSTIAHNIAEALKMKGFTKIDADVYEAYDGDTVLADISCVKGTNTFKMEAVDTDQHSMTIALNIISNAADRYADCSNQTYKLSPYHE